MAKKKAAANPSPEAPASSKKVNIPSAKRAIRGTDPKPTKGRRKKRVAYQALAYADAPGAKRVKTRKQRDKKLLKGSSSNFRKAVFQGHIKALLSGEGTKATAAEISKYKNSSGYLKAGAEALKRLQGTRKKDKVAGDYKKLQEKYTKQAETVLAKAIEKLKSKGMSDEDIKKSLSEGSDALASKAAERLDKSSADKNDRRKNSSSAGQSQNNVATQRKSATKKEAAKTTPKKSSTKKVAPVEKAKGKQRAASSPKAKSATPKKTVKKAALGLFAARFAKQSNKFSRNKKYSIGPASGYEGKRFEGRAKAVKNYTRKTPKKGRTITRSDGKVITGVSKNFRKKVKIPPASRLNP